MRSTLFALLLVGCMDGGSGKPLPIDPLFDPPLTEEQQAWVDHALPVLQAACVHCHADKNSSIGFLAGDTPLEIRETFIASGVIDFNAEPSSSRIFTKGVHQGPSLSAQELSELLEWFQIERAP
jgi:hypothetical protein